MLIETGVDIYDSEGEYHCYFCYLSFFWLYNPFDKRVETLNIEVKGLKVHCPWLKIEAHMSTVTIS